MSFTASAPGDTRPPRRGRIRLGAAALSGLLAAAAALSLAGPAVASASRTGGAGVPAAAAGGTVQVVRLSLRAMPTGTVSFGRTGSGRLTVRTAMYGLTPSSSHNVDLVSPGPPRVIRFSTLTATSGGSARTTLASNFTGRLPRGSRLLIRMGVQGRVAAAPIAETRRLFAPGGAPLTLIPVEVSTAGVSFGTPQGRATISYNGGRRTLTVTVHASGLTPGRHAAHIHLGSCMSQGPVTYMLRDLVADRRGRIAQAVRVFTGVTAPIPARGWYLNIHQGNSGNIQTGGGQPTIFFRPLLCANIRG